MEFAKIDDALSPRGVGGEPTVSDPVGPLNELAPRDWGEPKLKRLYWVAILPCPETCYTSAGILHQEPCGIAVHRHAEPSVPMSLARKDGKVCSASALYNHPTLVKC